MKLIDGQRQTLCNLIDELNIERREIRTEKEDVRQTYYQIKSDLPYKVGSETMANNDNS
jgi:hypothetical protein